MLKRAVAMLALVGSMLPLLAVNSVVHAQDCPTPFWGIYCRGYIRTDFGPVARATQVSGDRKQARYGNYSPLTREFLPITDWMPIHKEEWFRLWVRATDEYYGTFVAYASVVTQFGEAAWGVQGQDLGDYGWVARWGIYNFNSGLFYPDQTGRESWRPMP